MNNMVIRKTFKINLYSILGYLVALFVILECRSVFSTILKYSLPIKYFCIVSLLLFCLYGLCSGKLVLRKNKLLIIILYLSYVILFIIINYLKISSRTDFIIKFIIFIPLIAMIESKDKASDSPVSFILKRYANIMCVLALLSLFFWLLGSELQIISPTGTLNYEWGDIRVAKSYFGVYYEVEKDNFLFFDLYRNVGIFTEGPMYSLNLSISLLVNLFIYKNKIISPRNIVLIVAICSCISITGAVVAAIACVCRLMIDGKKKVSLGRVVGVVTAIILLVVFENLLDMKSETGSYLYRMNDYAIGFQAWMDNFFFGGGYGMRNYLDYLPTWRVSVTAQGYSNSLFWILAQCGIYLFMVYFIPAVVAMREYIKHKEYSYAVLCSCIWLLVITTSFGYQFILLLMIALWFEKIKEKFRLVP